MHWANLIPLLIFTAAVVGFFLLVRPRLREARRRRWADAGLLPEQLDPEGERLRRAEAERARRDADHGRDAGHGPG
ncbi:hypothetical protein G9U51_12100 [Calidifontibacter sp. DB0510]|uniref:Uncharacterized protein n=1 Tax=Metallococcus carri TaxID=1656884 RepID=A0A967EFD0_9MICO|nr:hypothetical protein [Metallococcus carri]NHN56521.1 hypothetical protein [Metallococcus carri]NOP38820.1 hypothetical protein [Calidifontibacter sp. DB2511S]